MYSEAPNVLSFVKITYAKGQSNITSIVVGDLEGNSPPKEGKGGV